MYVKWLIRLSRNPMVWPAVLISCTIFLFYHTVQNEIVNFFNFDSGSERINKIFKTVTSCSACKKTSSENRFGKKLLLLQILEPACECNIKATRLQ